MSTSASNDHPIEAGLTEEAWKEVAETREAPPKACKPRWRSIEQYWEERKLRERLKDYLVDED